MRSVLVGASFFCVCAPVAAGSQLRPLAPLPWRILTERATVSAEVGVSRLLEQRASLAGTRGDLWELGNFALGWRTGRVVLEVAGTAQRLFNERSRFAEPVAGVTASDGTRRHDSGDYRISTTVLFTPAASPVEGALRFGTRLPATDNETGLDRDAMDFFATVGAASTHGRLALSGEGGLGIHGTREPRFEQDDLFLYAVRVEYRALAITPSVEVQGQVHGSSHSAIRGVENLGELRAGLRAGSTSWLRLEVVRGYETFSPSWGAILTAGILR